MIKAAILTISDKGSRGEREDKSGEAIKEMLAGTVSIVHYEVIPDERDVIRERLIHLSDRLGAELIITTGGTGVSPRDVTPEATRDIIERDLPGMAEAMRAESLKKTPHAMISRAVCGIRGRTLIINLPGSPKAVRENLGVVLPAIPHAVEKICGSEAECGQQARSKTMVLKEQFEVSGNWLFRKRSYLPLLLFVLALPAAASYRILEERLDRLWELLCLAVSLSGLAIRVYTIGYAQKGTSGRNTTHQKAGALNTEGMYSIVRHPLYLGNYIIWLGISMFFRLWWASALVSLIYWLYYERIIFAEEAFLSEKFGDQFREWAARTPAFIPNFKRWKPAAGPFALRQVLKREQSGFMGIIAPLTFFEVLGNLMQEGRLEIDIMWVYIFFGSLAIFLTLTGLKKARLL